MRPPAYQSTTVMYPMEDAARFAPILGPDQIIVHAMLGIILQLWHLDLLVFQSTIVQQITGIASRFARRLGPD